MVGTTQIVWDFVFQARRADTSLGGGVSHRTNQPHHRQARRANTSLGGGVSHRTEQAHRRQARRADTSLARHGYWTLVVFAGAAKQNKWFSPRMKIRFNAGTGDAITDSSMSFSASSLNLLSFTEATNTTPSSRGA